MDTQEARKREDLPTPRRKRRKFTPEEKTDAVRMVREVGNLAKVARDLDLTETSLRNWVKQADIDEGQVPGHLRQWGEAKEVILRHVSITENDIKRQQQRALGWGRKREAEFPRDTYLPKEVELTEGEEIALQELIDRNNADIQSLVDATIELYRDAYEDYYQSERFPRVPFGAPKPDSRPRHDSAFWTEVTVNHGGWTCVLDFRSEDYPVLDEHFRQIE